MNNGKVRIYDLSKELNLDNKDVKKICDQLNIAVKSHSSTITESQAQQVRAAAKSYDATENGDSYARSQPHRSNGSQKPSVDGGSGKNRRNNKRKQQILAIHHRSSSARQNAQENRNPSLAAPPVRPAAVNDNINEAQAGPSKQRESDSHGSAAVDTQSAELNSTSPSKPLLKAPPKVETTQQQSATIAETEAGSTKPKLISPPARPQSPATTVESANQEQIKAPKPPAKAPKTEPEKTGIQSVPAAKGVAPKLQKPQRPKPPNIPESKIEPVASNDNDIETEKEEEDDTAVLLEPPKRPKPSKKKAVAKDEESPRRTWREDDDEVIESKLKASKSSKGSKKRLKPIIDDEDEFDTDIELSDSSTEENVNLSLVRPPKPKHLQPETAKAGVTSRPKKATKPDKTRNIKREREEVAAGPPESITLEDSLTVRDLAQKLNIPATEIITKLFFKGIPVNITQTLDIETATLVAEELGVNVETTEAESSATKSTEMLDVEDLEKLQLRPPVVTIMGHVDHGKTTLLDSIRKTKVAAGEAGGITQHIGAYHVDIEHEGTQRQIVFLDTPGHEAFTAMRARGARVTDIAILVVAADDGVRPQTKEAISHAKAAGVPIVVAINKMDKPEAQPDRVKQELSELQLVPEEWGGDTIMVPVSALKGENLDQLLEMIWLVAEIEELSANPDRLAKGTIIEAHLDRARGPVATLLVQNGTLKVGDSLVAGAVFGKIRAMIDDRGTRVEAATPSFAVEVLGLSDVPPAGDEFDVYESEREARAVADQNAQQKRSTRLQQSMSSRRVTLSSLSAQAQEGELKELNLIIKADVQGSVEAIMGALQQLPQDEVQIRVLMSAPGEISETDIDLAAASGAVVIGFNTTLASGAQQAADREGVDVRQYNIIYKLLDEIEGAMEGLLDPEEVEEHLGEAEVRAVFTIGRGAVAGCYVRSGKLLRNSLMRVRRGDEVVYEGVLDSLRRVKDDVREVNSGYECGVDSDKFNNWQEGDVIESYQKVYKRRTLAGNS